MMKTNEYVSLLLDIVAQLSKENSYDKDFAIAILNNIRKDARQDVIHEEKSSRVDAHRISVEPKGNRMATDKQKDFIEARVKDMPMNLSFDEATRWISEWIEADKKAKQQLKAQGPAWATKGLRKD